MTSSSDPSPADADRLTDPSGASVAFGILWSLIVAGSVAIIGIVTGAVLVAAAVFSLQTAAITITPLLQIILSLALATGVGFGGVALAYLWYRGSGIRYIGFRIPSLRDIAFSFGGYVASLILLIIAVTIISTIGAETAPNTAAQAGMENPEILLLLIPASFLLIAPGEELLYRGIVQNRLCETLPVSIAIVLASLIFASIHYFSLAGAPQARLVSISVLVLPTLVFGTVYELTDNLVVPVLIHGAYNATLFSLLYVSIKFSSRLAQTPGIL
ncbi:CPBP family intramembrane glutamic endopeptidase [Haloquadratum walsbyi]|uniref:Putative metal-dependent membrane protease n=1 Tax=Haloquadratum walsbyi J07HQW2 TaxID=1238425 RepID=U1PT03_9EURY|nr:CPBP family intramembrane glutamic endopeptidase [Haloquadratum walsbyi]ERG95496.1 MAG: putative metal-dependent membrane protease [Haloquadratum walsbyi J07HQW2]